MHGKDGKDGNALVGTMNTVPKNENTCGKIGMIEAVGSNIINIYIQN